MTEEIKPPLSYLMPDLQPEQVRQFVDRLGELSWVKTSLLNPDSIAIMWSETGSARMAEIHHILKRWMPSLFNGTGGAGLIARSIGVWRIYRFLQKRDRWSPSRLETKLLIAFAVSNAYVVEGKETTFYYSSLKKFGL